jgi:hypothetical protein
MLDTERFQGGGGSWALAFMVPPLFLAVWNIKKSMARRDDFLEHPICKQLKKHGDPRELAGMIEHEVRDSTTAVQIGGLTITKNWLISRYPLGLEVRRLDELVWAHRHELTTSVYFVPVSKSQSMYIYFNDRSKFMVSPSMKDCDRILQVLAERAPWAIYGFSAEKSRTWNKTPDVVIAQVEKNKSKLKEEAKGKGKSDAAGTEKGTGGPFA